MFQDTHIHVQDLKDKSAINAFVGALETAGFGRLINCAITPADWALVRALADEHTILVPSFGVHPWFADILDKGWEIRLEAFLRTPGALAGEMGLDKARKNIDMDVQKDVFATQLKIAAKVQKPFSVHCVRAWEETVALIQAHAPGQAFLLHSFNGSREIAARVTEMGGYLSFPAKAIHAFNDTDAAVLKTVRLDRILIETDFPYQIKWTVPQDYIELVQKACQKAAAIKGVAPDAFTRQVFENGRRFVSS